MSRLLVRLPSVRRRGLRRIGGGRWIATDDDPGFVFFLHRLPFSYVIFQLKEAERLLDPQVFIDRGKGFLAEDMVELRTTRDGIYVVALKTLGGVRKLRFDPSSYPSQFEFHAYASFDLRSVKAFVGRRLGDAGRGTADGRYAKRSQKAISAACANWARRARPVNIRDHLDEVLGSLPHDIPVRSPAQAAPP